MNLVTSHFDRPTTTFHYFINPILVILVNEFGKIELEEEKKASDKVLKRIRKPVPGLSSQKTKEM